MIQAQLLELSVVLQIKNKTSDDYQFIYDQISKLPCFNDYLSRKEKLIGLEDITDFCQNLQSIKLAKDDLLYKEGDEHNGKFYIIISGQASLLRRYPKNRCMSLMKIKPIYDVKINNNIGTVTTSSPKKTLSLIPCSYSAVKSNPQYDRNSKASLVNLPSCVEEIQLPTMGGGLMTDIYNDTLMDNVFEMSGETSRLGKFIRDVEEGDVVAEDTRFEHEARRSETALCTADCEFVSIPYRKFDALVMRQRYNRDKFLLEVFSIDGYIESLSRQSQNNFFASFQFQVFNKGVCLTVEGEAASSDENECKANFFVIYTGECRVEKALKPQIDGGSEEDQAKMSKNSDIYSDQRVKIAIVGKGTFVGEEVLAFEGRYNYTVKAATEEVVVCSISRNAFDSPLFHDLRNYILKMYQSKKAQRDAIVDNARKEYESNIRRHRCEVMKLNKIQKQNDSKILVIDDASFYDQSPKKLTALTTKYASLSPVNRSSRKITLKTNSLFTGSLQKLNESLDQIPVVPVSPISPETRGLFKVAESYSPKQRKVISKVKHVVRTDEDFSSNFQSNTSSRNNIESIRLFETRSPKSEKIKKARELSLGQEISYYSPKNKEKTGLTKIIMNQISNTITGAKFQQLRSRKDIYNADSPTRLPFAHAEPLCSPTTNNTLADEQSLNNLERIIPRQKDRSSTFLNHYTPTTIFKREVQKQRSIIKGSTIMSHKERFEEDNSKLFRTIQLDSGSIITDAKERSPSKNRLNKSYKTISGPTADTLGTLTQLDWKSSKESGLPFVRSSEAFYPNKETKH